MTLQKTATMFSIGEQTTQTCSIWSILTGLLLDYEDESFDVYFQGIDVTATDMVFDQQSKSIVFDVEKTKGTFYNDYFFPRQATGFGISCPLIHIEQPLLHGYFTTTPLMARKLEHAILVLESPVWW